MITLYSKPGCIQCDRTAKALTRGAVAYTTRDVTADPAALEHITQGLGYQQVPVVETDTEHWSGYQPDKIKGLTRAARQPDPTTTAAATATASPSCTR